MNTVELMYEISKLNLDSTSNFSGRLNASSAYIDSVDNLNSKYSDLYITAVLSYIRFESDSVENICKTNWGDSTGLSTSSAATVTNIANTSGTSFASSGIVDISWLTYFTQATQLSADLF